MLEKCTVIKESYNYYYTYTGKINYNNITTVEGLRPVGWIFF